MRTMRFTTRDRSTHHSVHSLNFRQRTLATLLLIVSASHAWSIEISDEASCLAAPAQTSWSVDGCTLGADLSTVDLRLRTTLTVEPGATLTVSNVFNCAWRTCDVVNKGLIVIDGGMWLGRVGVGFGGNVLNTASAQIEVNGRITMEGPGGIGSFGLIENSVGAAIINRGTIKVEPGNGIVNEGRFSNPGMLTVDCGRFEDTGLFVGNPIDAMYCFSGSGLWSDVSQWSRNGLDVQALPSSGSRVWIRGVANLDTNYTVGNSLEIGARWTSTGGLSGGGQLVVGPGVILTINPNGALSGNFSPISIVNRGLVENSGTINRTRIQNENTFYNGGELVTVLDNRELALFQNLPGGTARISATTLGTNDGVIENLGHLQIGSGSGTQRCDAIPINFARCWFNYGSITNLTTGTLDITHGLWIRDGGELNNYGVMSIRERFFDVGGIAGPGLLRVDRFANVLHEGLITVGPIVQDNRPPIPGKIENSGRFEKNGAVRNEGSVDNQGHFCGRGPFTGNAPTGVPFVTICDTTPPVIVPNLSGTLGNEGWYTSDIVLSWTVTEIGSQVFSFSGCNVSTITSDTPGTTRTCSAESFGGRGEASVTYKRDATGPTLAPVVMPDPVMQGLAAIVAANAEEPPFGSGLATFDCGPVDTSTLGPQVVTCTAEDVAGNNSTADGTYTVITPAEAAGNLVEDIEDSGVLGPGEESLTGLLASAVASLDRGNETAGRNKLNAFINEVNARAGHSISAEDAEALIAAALLILQGIEVE